MRNKLFITASSAALLLGAGLITPAAAQSTGVWITFEGGYSFFSTNGNANNPAIQCIGCGDTVDITGPGYPVNYFDSDFDDPGAHGSVSIGFQDGMMDHVLSTSFGTFSSESLNVTPTDYNSVGTPYGSCSTSTILCDSKDNALFFNVDWERGHSNTAQNTDAEYRFFYGLRTEYFRWERDANQLLSSSNSFAGSEISEFFGIGPRVGGSAIVPLDIDNAAVPTSFFVEGSGGVLLGNLTNDISPDSYEEFVAVPFVEAEAGFKLDLGGGKSLQFGYQGSGKFGIIAAGGVCTNDYADTTRGITTFHGTQPCGGVGRSDAFAHGMFVRLTIPLS